jgi:hypothetical protein
MNLVKKIKKALSFPWGVDEKYDKACKDSFYKFLDRAEIIFDTVFILVAITCLYFFLIY